MTSLMRQQGPYIPFETPVPIPTALSDDAPLSHICFNSEWLPAVIGALKVLCRPETWEGTDEDIRSVIASAHDLIATYSSGCDIAATGPNWYLDLEVSNGHYDHDAWFNPIFYVTSGGIPAAEYILFVWADGIFNPDVTISGRAVSDDSYVGGRFDDWFIQNESDPAGQAYVLTTLDCLGNLVVNTDFTPRHYSGDFQGGQFVAGNATVYMMHITIQGDYTCVGA